MRQQGALAGVLALQEKMLANNGFGITVKAEQIYNAAADMAKLTQLDPDRYFTDPSRDAKAQQKLQMLEQGPPQDPMVELNKKLVEIEHERNMIKAGEAQAKAQDLMSKAQMMMEEAKLKQEKLDLEHAKAVADSLAVQAEIRRKWEADLDELHQRMAELALDQTNKQRELQILEQDLALKREGNGSRNDIEARKVALLEGEKKAQLEREKEAAMADYKALQKIVSSMTSVLETMKTSNAEAVQVIRNVRTETSGALEAQTQMLGGVLKTMEGIAAHISAPKRIVRDKQGRPSGIETVQ
jgi:hypothetical protein